MRSFTIILIAGTLLASAGWTTVSGQVCAVPQNSADGNFVAQDGMFTAVCDLPADFALGLVKIGSDFVLTDRHEDLLIFCGNQGKRGKTIEYPAYEPSALTWDGKLLVAGDRSNGRIYFQDPVSGECLRTIESPLTPITGLACDAAGKLWVAANGSKELQLIDPLDGTTLASIPSPAAKLSALAFDPNGYLWAADSDQDRIYLVDIRTGYTIFYLKAPGPVVSGLWLDGQTLFATDYQTDQLYRCDVYALAGKCVRSDSRRGKATLYSEVENLGPGEVTGGTMVLAIPTDGPNQDLDSVSWTDGAQRETDQWGQKVALYELGRLDPGQKKSVRLEGIGTFYRISTKIYPHLVGDLSEIPADIAGKYLADADKYRVQGDYIQNKVKEVVGDETNPYFKARKLYDFLIGRINYQMVGGWDIAPTVIERGTGSCSEYTFSIVSLCRAAGIPARYVGTMVLRGEDASIDTAYHRWAEIYLPHIGWIPVDVNAGDRPWQGDRCFWFGGIQNRFLITTRGGGDSRWLNWGYNVETAYRTQGKANVRTEGFAEWDVVDK